jgi:hypothetical protein
VPEEAAALKTRVHFFSSAYDNLVEQFKDYDWPELVADLTEHTVVERKNDLGFVVGTFNTTAGFEPAADDPEGRPGRYSKNLVSVGAAVLDVDGGWTIEEAVEQLSGVTHLGYTSWSHRLPGKGDRFRLVVPFVDPCPRDEWDLRKRELIELFPRADPSSVANARIFFAPTCSAENRQLARAWHRDATTFDWRWLKRRAPPEPVATLTPADRAKLVSGGSGRARWETFDLVQFMRDQGLYKRQVTKDKHDVRCPNRDHEDGGTAIWQDGSKFPTFYCSHAKCAGFDFWDHYKRLLGKGWMIPYCLREVSAVARLAEETERRKLRERR